MGKYMTVKPKSLTISIILLNLLVITILGHIATADNPWVKGPLPDALTRATDSGYGAYEGKLEYLYDGKLPGGIRRAQPFYWQVRGMLIVTFEETVLLKEFKFYVGEDDGIFELNGYLGGKTLLDGGGRSPAGRKKFSLKNDERQKETWVRFILSEPDTVDNLEFWTIDSCDIYELRVVTVNDSTPASGIHMTDAEKNQ